MLEIKVICEDNSVSKNMADNIQESFISKGEAYYIEEVTGINKKGDIELIRLRSKKTSYSINRFISAHPNRILSKQLDEEVTIKDIKLI